MFLQIYAICMNLPYKSNFIQRLQFYLNVQKYLLLLKLSLQSKKRHNIFSYKTKSVISQIIHEISICLLSTAVLFRVLYMIFMEKGIVVYLFYTWVIGLVIYWQYFSSEYKAYLTQSRIIFLKMKIEDYIPGQFFFNITFYMEF